MNQKRVVSTVAHYVCKHALPDVPFVQLAVVTFCSDVMSVKFEPSEIVQKFGSLLTVFERQVEQVNEKRDF